MLVNNKKLVDDVVTLEIMSWSSFVVGNKTTAGFRAVSNLKHAQIRGKSVFQEITPALDSQKCANFAMMEGGHAFALAIS